MHVRCELKLRNTHSLDGELLLREAALDALACPNCKGPVVESSEGGARCVNCKTALPQTKLDQLRQVRVVCVCYSVPSDHCVAST